MVISMILGAWLIRRRRRKAVRRSKALDYGEPGATIGSNENETGSGKVKVKIRSMKKPIEAGLCELAPPDTLHELPQPHVLHKMGGTPARR
jgi:hypothetical protein